MAAWAWKRINSGVDPLLHSSGESTIHCYRALSHPLLAQVGAFGFVNSLHFLGRCPNVCRNQRKSEIVFQKLQVARSLDMFVGYNCSFDDHDILGTSTVPRRHFVVHALNSPVHCGVAVLLVHVVLSRPTTVSQPDSKVLDRRRILLIYFVAREDLAVNALYLLEERHKVPVPPMVVTQGSQFLATRILQDT